MSFLTKRVKATDLDESRTRMLVHDLPWYVDAAFTVHVNGRSHTGDGLNMKKGFAISISGGQKLTKRSSTEATVGVDDCMSLILWARLFLKAPRY